MSVLLQVSDPHFGTELPEVLAALQHLVERQKPQVLVVSGDITQRATVAQFQRARRWLDALPVADRLILPGNHDIPLFNLLMRAVWPYERYRRGLAQTALSPDLQSGPFHLVGVKTTRRLRHIDGQISADQIAAAERRLAAAAPTALRLVVTHQPLWVDRTQDLRNRCHGADVALQRLTAAGADLFLAGHIHWPFVEALPQCATAWAVNAGTCASRRIREGAPNSCNLIRYAPDQGSSDRQCEVERWDCPLDGAGFRLVRRHTLQLA